MEDHYHNTSGTDGSAAEEKIAVQLSAEARALKKREALKITGCTFLIFTVYATMRYNIFSNVPWVEWPVFVMNKIVALTSLGLLFLTIFNFFLRKQKFNSKLLFYAGILAIVHSVVSLLILSPGYYPKLYENEKLTFIAGQSILLGLVVMVFFFLGRKKAKVSTPFRRMRGIAFIVFLGGIHAGLLGYKVWFQPVLWPGNLPPLTMISFAMGTITLIILFLKSRSYSKTSTRVPAVDQDYQPQRTAVLSRATSDVSSQKSALPVLNEVICEVNFNEPLFWETKGNRADIKWSPAFDMDKSELYDPKKNPSERN